MKPDTFKALQKALRVSIVLSVLAILLLGFVIVFSISPQATVRFIAEGKSTQTKQVSEVDIATTKSLLADDPNLPIVIANCTNCHSERLIIQNMASREGWLKLIQWMQEKQGLWPLGTNEEIILNYLAKNYAPKTQGRRASLENIEWYPLEE